MFAFCVDLIQSPNNENSVVNTRMVINLFLAQKQTSSPWAQNSPNSFKTVIILATTSKNVKKINKHIVHL